MIDGRDWVEHCLIDLGSVLEGYGFLRADRYDRETYEHYHKHWHRDRDWRVDGIRLIYPREYLTNVKLSVGVFVPCSGHSLTDSWVDGRAIGDYAIPSKMGIRLWPGMRIRRIGRETRRWLSWFDQYEKPKQCLDALTEGRTNWGETRGPTVLALESRLTELIEMERVRHGLEEVP